MRNQQPLQPSMLWKENTERKAEHPTLHFSVMNVHFFGCLCLILYLLFQPVTFFIPVSHVPFHAFLPCFFTFPCLPFFCYIIVNTSLFVNTHFPNVYHIIFSPFYHFCGYSCCFHFASLYLNIWFGLLLLLQSVFSPSCTTGIKPQKKLLKDKVREK